MKLSRRSLARNLASGSVIFGLGLYTLYTLEDSIPDSTYLWGPVVLALLAGFVINHWVAGIVVVLVHGLLFAPLTGTDWPTETLVILLFGFWPLLAIVGTVGWITRLAWSYRHVLRNE